MVHPFLDEGEKCWIIEDKQIVLFENIQFFYLSAIDKIHQCYEYSVNIIHKVYMGNKPAQKFTIIAINEEQTFQLKAHPNETIEDLQKIIKKEKHLPIRYLVQFTFEGNKLSDRKKKLRQWGISEGSILRFTVIRCYDIGVFTDNLSSPFSHILTDTRAAHTPSSQVLKLIEFYNGQKQADFLCESIQIPLKIREDILCFTDKKFKQALTNQKRESLQDFQIDLKREQLSQVVGQIIVLQLQQIFKSDYNRIIIRRTSTPGKFIGFHTDHSIRTLQLCLNGDDEFEGGHLVYARKQSICIPPRKAGIVTVHSSGIVHGVSILESGVRFGLFLLKEKRDQ